MKHSEHCHPKRLQYLFYDGQQHALRSRQDKRHAIRAERCAPIHTCLYRKALSSNVLHTPIRASRTSMIEATESRHTHQELFSKEHSLSIE